LSPQLCISISLIDPLFHGATDGNNPEWPPSPLRLFQAMLAGARAGCRNRMWSGSRRKAFQWLENLAPPLIIAPTWRHTVPHVYFVPNNDGDKKFDRQDRLTAKVFHPVRLLSEDEQTISYVWDLGETCDEEAEKHIQSLVGIAREVLALGWGIDMAVGNGIVMTDTQVAMIPGERWLAGSKMTNHGLRIPVRGTLGDVLNRYERFRSSVGVDEFAAPPALSVYSTVDYRRSTDPPRRPIAAFSLLKPDGNGFQPFDVVRQALTVSGMLRHTTRLSAERLGWSTDEIDGFVLGHGEPKSAKDHSSVGPNRFAYIPLPSIEYRGGWMGLFVGPIRRAILSSFSTDCETQVAWARRILPGQSLIKEGDGQSKTVAVLSKTANKDNVVEYYTARASSWTTVTPVVLPGYDDPAHYRRRLKEGVDAEEQKRLLSRLSERIDGLLRKAIIQAGFSKQLADHAEIEWRKPGFWPGVDLADKYGVPDHLKRFSRYHVKIKWFDSLGNSVAIPGPICIGGGRYYGIGLFAALGQNGG